MSFRVEVDKPSVALPGGRVGCGSQPQRRFRCGQGRAEPGAANARRHQKSLYAQAPLGCTLQVVIPIHIKGGVLGSVRPEAEVLSITINRRQDAAVLASIGDRIVSTS